MSKKLGSDGYLLPKYWKCIVCKAGENASNAIRASVFLLKFRNEKNFQELDQKDRAEIAGYIEWCLSAGGSTPDPATQYLEDTVGLARDRSGMGFDAVFLCDAHSNEFMQASF